ncbi:GDP-L-fucose synthase family protein [Flavobacterium pallidum]|uniref:GDP-L-fucose synthase n=1 Tax=Flavobacterium pallidum TaxID=2172098 RepID=A0A2S1SGW0_9FLAO|nr:GDP-L-fucose synthase [Flavobacterium pallidum]AWI25648.1 GDP-fucose synthetase [Flavobacterium pallidum]
MIEKSAKIFITGHSGMLGSKTLQRFKDTGYKSILTATHSALDLKDQASVNRFFLDNKPDYVIHIAAKVGGINANINHPASFLYDNLMMQANVIHAAYSNGVKKFVFIASSCIYPRESQQPMREEYLLDGKPEPTNEGYAIAKIAGVKLLESYKKQYGFNGLSLIPSNLYGPNDSFDLEHAHVLSSLVKRFSDAKKQGQKSVTLWGSGIAQREFLHTNDFSEAILYFFENEVPYDYINIGPGTDISIKDLANLIAAKTAYDGEIIWDKSKPDGMLRKCMDVSKMRKEGFNPKITLEDGIDEVIMNYKKIQP